ncbi:hypothetical protein HanXRQr2_Chr13g0581381 [Helianthus annuus]|uniref:Uncharacterized protein n=1 Tax=Helianthus annuus TaxID=4232 RepID=A0A9K3HBU1_HELAN|nr:hypothetical protein HanXRQr2_Chr13g0581381 [Helianthus annuus]
MARIVFIDIDNRDDAMEIVCSMVLEFVREIKRDELFFGRVESIDCRVQLVGDIVFGHCCWLFTDLN